MKTSAQSGGPNIVERLLVEPLRGLLTWRPGADGRLFLIVVVAGYLAAIAAGRLVWGVDIWPFLGVPSGPSLFFDARNLTAAWECQRLGYDPLYESPCDPWGRPLMYLRPWLLFGPLGLDQSHTFVIAVVLITALFVSFCLLVPRVPLGTGIVLAIAACSPAVMLGVERGNMDLFLFSVLAASILLWRAFPSVARVLSPVIVLLAATTELYPVFALPAFVATRSQIAARAAAACAAAFVVYIAYSFRDVAHATRIATQGEGFSYGVRILPAHLYHLVGADRWAGPGAVKQLLAVVPVGFLAVVIVTRVRRRLVASNHDQVVDSASFVAFYAGALIYLGTFAIANNFDYRLVFLLLTFPQLLQWASEPAHRLSSLAVVTLAAIVLLLWVGSLWRWLNLWDELASWALAGLFVALIAATMPSLESLQMAIGGGRVLQAGRRRS